MYQIDTRPTQTRTTQLSQTFRNSNNQVSTSTGVIHNTSVSRPHLRSNQMKDKIVQNNSQVKIKQKKVEDHRRISSISNKTKSVTTCNDSLMSRTLNVNAVCVTCGKYVFNSIYDACVSKFLNDVNARSKKPQVVPIIPRKPIRKINQSVATLPKKTIASYSTIQKSKSYYRMLYEKTSKAWTWWIEKQCPSGYQWIPKTKMKWVPKITNKNILQIILFIVDSGCTKHMTGNLKLLCNFVEKYLGTVWFRNDQFAPILGYRDLVQGNITIKRVYYVEGLNRKLFSVGQFCDVDMEVAFKKSTCYIRDLQGNDLLTGTRGSYLYTIALQESSSPTLICFLAKASPTQACCTYYLVRDGENLDKMKEKGDPCIFVGYSTTSKGYRIYNKRTKLIIESIHINFDKIKEMTYVDNNTSGLTPQLQITFDHNRSELETNDHNNEPSSSKLVPNVSPPADIIDSLQ
ncbi:hypothetical protein Tco_0499376 [Tanacetum coccineum]